LYFQFQANILPVSVSFSQDAIRGASRGSVWLSWQTLLHCRYSALKPIKYQPLSLQVSNVGVLEQATAYIFLLTLHNTIMEHQRYCLV